MLAQVRFKKPRYIDIHTHIKYPYYEKVYENIFKILFIKVYMYLSQT